MVCTEEERKIAKEKIHVMVDKGSGEIEALPIDMIDKIAKEWIPYWIDISISDKCLKCSEPCDISDYRDQARGFH